MCYSYKEVTEAGKLAYISIFEIKPIIFSLQEDAKLGKSMRPKQKIREVDNESPVSIATPCLRKSPWEHRAVRYLSLSTSKQFQPLKGSIFVSTSLMRWEAIGRLEQGSDHSGWCPEKRPKDRLKQGDCYNINKRGQRLASKFVDPNPMVFRFLIFMIILFLTTHNTHRSL